MKIVTSQGEQRVARRIGVAGEYYQTVNGQWWTQNPQTGFVSVPRSSRALAFALTEAGDDCRGHEPSPYEPMGITVYCDGSCRAYCMTRDPDLGDCP